MSDRDRSLQADVDPNDPGKVLRAFREMATMVSPAAVVSFEVSQETANARNFTIKVTDKIGQRWKGRWLVLVYITDTEDGDPSSTGNTVAILAPAAIIQTLTANAAYLLLTGVDGYASFGLTIAGAATRHVYAAPICQVRGSGAQEWV